jgi:hypothetical protein
MRRLLGIGTLLLGTMAAGALYAQGGYDRDGGYARRPYRADLFDRVQSDLDRAARNAYPNGRIDHAFHELGEFRSRYNNGRPARHELDSAISAVRDLAKSDVLRPHDRSILENDVVDMRRFRDGYRERVY